MGAEPPFLYEKPSSYTFSGATNQSFNPTAATQASRAAKQPKPKQDGPLIDAKELNRHPDSYFVVPYGNLDWKPMNRHTKTIVKWVRVFLLILRICAFLGTAGLLVCVICVKPVGDTLDWIIRIPVSISNVLLRQALRLVAWHWTSPSNVCRLSSIEVSKRSNAWIFRELYDICCHHGRKSDTLHRVDSHSCAQPAIRCFVQ